MKECEDKWGSIEESRRMAGKAVGKLGVLTMK